MCIRAACICCSIINDVLDMSKIEAGKLELTKQAVILQTVINDVIRIVHERASSRGIQLMFEAAEEPVVIWGDERAMKQVFINLLSNAIKFSREQEPVFIRVNIDPPGTAIVEVEDHGIGMDEQEQETSAATIWSGQTGDNPPIWRNRSRPADHQRLGRGT